MSDSTGHILIGNSFPMSLIRRPVSIVPLTRDELLQAMIGRQIVSYWGHANTLKAVKDWLGVDLTPHSERPAIQLTEAYYPELDGMVFQECYVLSPDYKENFRPAIGMEVSADSIRTWQVLHVSWA